MRLDLARMSEGEFGELRAPMAPLAAIEATGADLRRTTPGLCEKIDAVQHSPGEAAIASEAFLDVVDERADAARLA